MGCKLVSSTTVEVVMFKRSRMFLFFISLFSMTAFCVSSVWAVVDISNIPLDAQTKAAPANIMFVLDDSGSMDWEMMTIESNGLFSNQYYVFDNAGDNLYSGTRILTDAQRLMWKSQWSQYNKMYYDPSVTYTHWPTLADADPDNPRSHPNVAGNTFNLSSTYVQFVSLTPGGSDIIVDNLDAGFSTVSGTWTESGASPEYAGSSLYSGSNPASARWTINVPTTDSYQVLVWWSSGAGWSRDTAAQYLVNHASGTQTYTRDQTQNFGQWNALGSHVFNAGTTTIDVVHNNNITSADAVRLIQGAVINIPRAHYYVYSATEARPYLVTIDGGSINYYAVTVTGTGGTESVADLQLNANPPADVQISLTYAEARQNFANWYSFYRRRELTATAAVSNVISQMAGVQIGISTINDRINQPVLKVKVGGVDQTSTLLTTLYNLVLQANGTPLRRGLEDVGQYFHANDGIDGGIGTCPYWSVADGGECQQAFAILMTDGYWGGLAPAVGNVDGDNGIPFADAFSPTLADVAMNYWENDLSSGLANLVTGSSVDPADWQHMVTYGVSFGVKGTLDPANYDLTASPPPSIPWPSPWAGSQQKIDDLYHASVNGHGVFLSASNPTELVSSLLSIMLDIKNRIGSASSVSVNGDELYKQIDNNTYMFQSSYDTVGWVGDIKSYKVDPDTGALDLSHPEWSTSAVWQGYNWATYWNLRPIATYNGTSGAPFRIGNLTTAQQILLDPSLAVATDILNYVRGDGSNEQLNGGNFRNRSSQLGDVVHSSPVYHKGLLYTGANDGMLHAIIAEGANAGREFFSYVPSQVIKNLSLLADPLYTHNYYVDLTATVEDYVPIAGIDKTILVGGLGQGGIGYYALDISNLTHYSNVTNLWTASSITDASVASRVLWEFPNTSTAATDLADIGYSFSKSVIVRTNDTTRSSSWVVIFGNGYNSADGQSVLFILDPATGNVLRKFELGSGPDNGLATPAVTDIDGDGKADYVYAGDLDGNMWKLDLTDSDINNWEVAFADASGADTPLFRATNLQTDAVTGAVTTIAQPITSMPGVMYHPEKHGYMVVFGTGKFLGTTDFLDKSVQTVYGVWDYGDDTDDREYLGTFDHATEQLSELSSHSTLLEQTAIMNSLFYDPDGDGDGEILRVLSDNSITWLTVPDSNSPSTEWADISSSADNNAGWYFDLPNSGERVVSQMMIRDGKAIFISFSPSISPCTPGGDSILHEVDAGDGSRLEKPVFDVNLDGVVDEKDKVTVTVTDPISGATTTVDVVASGVQRSGHLQTPAILKMGKDEIKYMSSTSGTVETVREKSPRIGVSSWQEF